MSSLFHQIGDSFTSKIYNEKNIITHERFVQIILDISLSSIMRRVQYIMLGLTWARGYYCICHTVEGGVRSEGGHRVDVGCTLRRRHDCSLLHFLMLKLIISILRSFEMVRQ